MSKRFVYLETGNGKSKKKSGASGQSIPTRTFFSFLADLMRLRIFHDTQRSRYDGFSYN